MKICRATCNLVLFVMTHSVIFYCKDILASSSRSTVFFIDFMSFTQICICYVFFLVVCMWFSRMKILHGLFYTMAFCYIHSKILQSIRQVLVLHFYRSKILILKESINQQIFEKEGKMVHWEKFIEKTWVF